MEQPSSSPPSTTDRSPTERPPRHRRQGQGAAERRTSGNIELGQIAGVPLAMHWSVIIVAWILTWSLATTSFPHHAAGHAQLTYWLAGIGAATAFFGSLLAHEMAHALVARRHAVEVTGLTLWLFGGVATLGSEPSTPRADLQIAAAGPATSLGLAVAFEALAIGFESIGIWHVVVVAATWLAGINLILGVFNLIPGAPLDGGRILRAAMWRHNGDWVRASVAAARAGRVVAFVLIGVGTLEFLVGARTGGLWLVFIGWFVLAAARAEELDATLRGKLAGLRAADVMSTPPVVTPSTMPVGEFIDEYVPRYRHSAYPVQDCDGRVLGVVTLARTMEVDRRERGVTSLADVVIPLEDVPVAAPDDALVTFMQRLDPGTGGQVLVFDGASVVGIVTERDVARAAELRDASRARHLLLP